MRILSAKCCVLALIAGGFAITGDAARVFARGRRVLESTTLPSHAADSPAEPTAAAAVAAAPPTAPPPDAPIGTPRAGIAQPTSSPESIDLATLSPGDRIVVWVGRRGSRKETAGIMTIALDVIDPQSAEVLEQRHVGREEQEASHAPLRRIKILGSVTESFLGGFTSIGPSGRISRRQSLQIVPIDRAPSRQGANTSQPEQAPVETIGPVQAMAVVRATATAP